MSHYTEGCGYKLTHVRLIPGYFPKWNTFREGKWNGKKGIPNNISQIPTGEQTIYNLILCNEEGLITNLSSKAYKEVI